MKIAIIGNIGTSGSNEVFLNKYLKIFLPMSEKIFVISDWKNMPTDSKVTVLNDIRIINRKITSTSLILRLFRFFLIQIIICLNLVRSARDAHILIFFPIPFILPMFLGKITRRKIVIFAAQRVDYQFFQDKSLKKRFFLNPLLRGVTRIAFCLSDLIVVESENLVRWLNLSKYLTKIRVGPTYVDTKIFRLPSNLKRKGDLIGYIGGLSEAKGVLNFVKAIPSILEKYPEGEFIIIGTGPLYSKLIDIITKLGLLNKVKIVGWVTNAEVAEWLSKLKLLVLPSVSEGLPNILLEGLSSGTLVLSTPVGGVPDLLIDEETGYIMQDNSPDCIANNVLRALFDFQQHEKISQAARILIAQKYTYGAALKRYQTFLLDLSPSN